MEQQVELKISEEYLIELINYCSRATCGKIMKRHEILQGQNEAIKLATKELIYEGFRELRDLVIAHNKGRDITIFKFKNKNHPIKRAGDSSVS
jgi:hypothetical protein